MITGEDLAKANLAWMPTLFFDKQMVLATGKVLFQAQEVAFVVAEDPYIAADAAELVEVEYESFRCWSIHTRRLIPALPFCVRIENKKTTIFFTGKLATGPRQTRHLKQQKSKPKCMHFSRVVILRRSKRVAVWPTFSPSTGTPDHLPDFPGTPCAPHALCHRRWHPGKQYPCYLTGYWRWFWEQGSHLSRICLRGGRVPHPEATGQVDRDAF